MNKAPKKPASPAVPESIEAYWNKIRHYHPLPRQREAELVRASRAGDESAMHELVTANLRFVVSVAKNYTGYGLTLIELISEGNIGLMEAVKRFDETRGFKFITYAVWWIRQAILKSIAEQSRAVRPPMSQINDLQKVDKQTNALAQELGRNPTLEELAKKAEISLDRTRNALEVGQRDASFDTPLQEDDAEKTLLTLYATEDDLKAVLEDNALHHAIVTCLDVLDEREQRIVCAYFGLEDRAPITLEEIGTTLGLTRERVRQLRDRALQKIRAQYGDTLVEFSRN